MIFSAALASLIARAAQAGFIALTAEHEHLKAASDPETYRALIEFSGNSQAKLDSTNGWLLGLGNLLGTGNAITWGLIVTALIALAVRAGADYALSVSAQRAAVGAKASIRQKLVHRVLATGGADTPEGTGATAVLLARGLNALDDYYTKNPDRLCLGRHSARSAVAYCALTGYHKCPRPSVHPAAYSHLHDTYR